MPKPLVTVAGRPLLAHVLDRLVACGAGELGVVAGFWGPAAAETFGRQWAGVPLRWTVQGEPEGPARALELAAEWVTGPFMVMHGDVLYAPDVSLAPVLARFQAEAPAAVLLTERRAPDSITRGAVRVDEEGSVLDLEEYPGPEGRAWGRVAAGFYVCSPEILRVCRAMEPSPAGEYELPDAFRELVKAGRRVAAVDLEGRRINVNTPQDCQAAERLLAES